MAGLGTNRTIGAQEKEVFGRSLAGIVFFLDTLFLFLFVSFTIQFDFFGPVLLFGAVSGEVPTTSATHVLNTYFLQPLESTLPPPSPYAETGNRQT